MIIGIGIDVVENNRFARELDSGPWMPGDGVFSTREIAQCRGPCKTAALRYAAFFAAKEATLKALGLRVESLRTLGEVEVVPNNSTHCVTIHGAVRTEAEKLGVRRINLSIARDAQETIATVIVED